MQCRHFSITAIIDLTENKLVPGNRKLHVCKYSNFIGSREHALHGEITQMSSLSWRPVPCLLSVCFNRIIRHILITVS